MAYSVSFKKSVQKDLKGIARVEVKRILDKIEHQLSIKPESFPELQGRFQGMRKFRVGDYRVVFVILDKEVLILKIAHRKDVYDK